ncbi:uncharacterized protein STEHIDRAFT_144471 [Stereum hirsutum FP-91666 SS1]|uniref:uncharacterized protein n=1 Tax=Stereum hirsutum (strain FP-91666) TaxID=721885 RepID=UPI000440DBC6|nr:uncharacterized protein STEHIDRAFT_144471 [Stereum hirsutum FP-91666 SS1]EIM91011.1 hypothetical protein STEHIDRAFT_144471 [Stereum hirsutum FP-91666 SS1]
MSVASLSLPKATLISLSLTCILYGFSLFMFFVTLWVLLHGRSATEISRLMLTFTCVFFTFSTVHVAVLIRHTIEGFLDQALPAEWFKDKSSPTFITILVLYACQCFTGDAVLIYRCYVVWERRAVIILMPVAFFCGYVGTMFTGIWAYAVYQRRLAPIMVVTAACCSIIVNITCSSLLGFRLWKLNTHILPQQLRHSALPVLHLVVDAALLYTLTLGVTLICLLVNTNAMAIMIELTVPLIAIIFYGVIIRVGITRASPSTFESTTDGNGSEAHERLD